MISGLAEWRRLDCHIDLKTTPELAVSVLIDRQSYRPIFLRGMVYAMNLQDSQMVTDLKERITAAIPTRLSRMIVFGSRARGEAAPDSDLDVVALVDNREPGLERRLDDIAYSVMWDHDFRPIISLKVFSEAEFTTAARKGYSFFRHVVSEGVAV